jgi:energy-coupling factor transporter ATP-binding protein EcfA2
MSNGIIISNVSFSYPDKTQVLTGIGLEIKKGSFLGITGVNGSGKSTLIYLLNGLIPHQIPGKLTGDVYINGEPVRRNSVSHFSRQVGLVFQNPDFAMFNLTVREEIAFGLNNFRMDKVETRINNALDQVGLIEFINRDPQTLSFGEKQKVCLAAVLALDTPIIVLDEPTAMLDFKSSLELYEILKKLNKTGKTIVTVEHDTDFLWKYAQESLILDKGRIHSMGLTKKILGGRKSLEKLGIKTPNYL